jgi:hypothetical protein
MRTGGFLDRIVREFEVPAFEALLAPTYASTRGAPGCPSLAMFQDRASAAAGG